MAAMPVEPENTPGIGRDLTGYVLVPLPGSNTMSGCSRNMTTRRQRGSQKTSRRAEKRCGEMRREPPVRTPIHQCGP